MLAKIAKISPVLIAGAAAVAIAVAPAADADPPPLPPCVNADGTPCAGIANIGAGGADGQIPFGPGGSADAGGATGGIPYGPVGSADRGGASGCIPNVGCLSIPAP